MADKVIKKNQALVPFWGDKMSFIKGLDPLGLQNASEKAYSYLLPGLNNVTGLIRAYSFYCWLLKEYARQMDSTDPAEQKKFIRKAEYILALLSHQHSIPGVSGIDYAARQFGTDDAVFDLQAGIYKPDGSTENTYWAYHFGVFGAYYLGSMRQIGIIDEPIDMSSGKPLGIYRATNEQNPNLNVTGMALAAAFETRIQPQNKALFQHCLETGVVHRDQLTALAADFNLRDIRPRDTEWTLLMRLLLDADEPGIPKEHPVSMRKATLLHVLRLAVRHPEGIAPRALAYYAYDVQGMEDGLPDDCLTGWYYYQLNEYYQYACTALLNAALDIVVKEVGTGWMSVGDLIEETATTVSESIMRAAQKKNHDATLGDIVEAISGSESELYQQIEKSETELRMTSAFLLLWKLYQTNATQFNRLKAFISERGLGVEHDVLAFLEQVTKSYNQPLTPHIASFLLHHILYRHRFVAFNKMGNGYKSTEKFVIEDNYIRVIDNFDPGFTGPRLTNLAAFLQDLHLLSSDRKVTEKGLELLNQRDI